MDEELESKDPLGECRVRIKSESERNSSEGQRDEMLSFPGIQSLHKAFSVCSLAIFGSPRRKEPRSMTGVQHHGRKTDTKAAPVSLESTFET